MCWKMLYNGLFALFGCTFHINLLRITGAERFDVVWLHNNKEIKPSKDFQYSSEANIHKLNIAEIFPEDAGTYTHNSIYGTVFKSSRGR